MTILDQPGTVVAQLLALAALLAFWAAVWPPGAMLTIAAAAGAYAWQAR